MSHKNFIIIAEGLKEVSNALSQTTSTRYNLHRSAQKQSPCEPCSKVRELGLLQKKPMFRTNGYYLEAFRSLWDLSLLSRLQDYSIDTSIANCLWNAGSTEKGNRSGLIRFVLYRYWLQLTVSYSNLLLSQQQMSSLNARTRKRRAKPHPAVSILYEIALNTSGLKPWRCPKGMSAMSARTCVRDLSLQCIGVCPVGQVCSASAFDWAMSNVYNAII